MQNSSVDKQPEESMTTCMKVAYLYALKYPSTLLKMGGSCCDSKRSCGNSKRCCFHTKMSQNNSLWSYHNSFLTVQCNSLHGTGCLYGHFLTGDK